MKFFRIFLRRSPAPRVRLGQRRPQPEHCVWQGLQNHRLHRNCFCFTKALLDSWPHFASRKQTASVAQQCQRGAHSAASVKTRELGKSGPPTDPANTILMGAGSAGQPWQLR